MKAFLVLEDGSIYEGESFGERRATVFEVVFNTSMTGYLEILTDMSYAGQGVALTYPLIGNYGVNDEDAESETPLIKALIVSELSHIASNYRSMETLEAFMKRYCIAGISHIDTRGLTTHIRNAGTMNAAIIYDDAELVGDKLSKIIDNIKKYDGAREAMDLLAARKAAHPHDVKVKANKPGLAQIALIDYGAKKSIQSMLEKRGCEVTVFPYDATASDIMDSPIQFDGIMLSNGPGDPKLYKQGIATVRELYTKTDLPIFGICLGHQILALASGADTVKLKYGHRGANHPVKDLDTGRVSITSQNHGYMVAAESLPAQEAYVNQINVNDRTVEGIKYIKRNAFSVQYHPEACAGPHDTEYLFDDFLSRVRGYRSNKAKTHKLQSVMVVGSGPIVIGQAAEFDYAGTQACRALREEGIYTILVNSNPATIMTDSDIADRVYIEPLTADELMRIIRIEKPQGILATLGGQTGLNLVMELEESGFLRENNVRLIGTTSETIRMAEDRQAFKDTLESIGEPCIESVVVSEVEDAVNFAEKVGLPVIIRPAYTLGGTGGGIAYTYDELTEISSSGIRASRVNQILVEKCISGWKEIEYECVRDNAGNAITVCSMENFDPVGIHTGDSIVVAPVQTLTDKENQMLRSGALRIVDALGITGGCNVQFALNPDDGRYAVIEVNPRVSRSSALASKATGYPIAKVAAKIALGYNLDEILNAVTGTTYASFEPALDYIAVKIPTWPFDKFSTATRMLGTQMKATGEVMSIAGSFEAGLLKAVRSLDGNMDALKYNQDKFCQMSDDDVTDMLSVMDDHRLFVIIEAIRRNIDISLIHAITKIDVWFLSKICNIVDTEQALKSCTDIKADKELLRTAKYMGFTDKMIAEYTGISERECGKLRRKYDIRPVYNMVDTCAAEFEAATPYYYSTYIKNPMYNAFGRSDVVTQEQQSGEMHKQKRKRVIVLGAGPIRIGQGIEFDYCSVHAVWALKKHGYEAIIINNNPETVSTDFDIADKLYFEPLTPEDVESVVEREKPCGAIVQFGGQTAIKLTKALVDMGVPILGTTLEGINKAEDRECFDAALEECSIKRPEGRLFYTTEEALVAASEIGYPVLVRPSYVLGGQGMSIAYSDDDVVSYMEIIRKYVQSDSSHPILMDKYVLGTEVEVDAVCDGTDVLIPGIMQHEERAGIHSGDSISVYPPQTLSEQVKCKIAEHTTTLAKALGVLGMINIQFIVTHDDDVYIIEANPRSSRTVPYISKVTHLPIVETAVRCILGEKLRDMEYGVGLYKEADTVAVKMPVFSFEKIKGADISLGPEMKSTGEVLGVSKSYTEALYKAFKGAGIMLPRSADGRSIGICVNQNDKKEIAGIAKEFSDMGYGIYATGGTCDVIRSAGIEAVAVPKIHEAGGNGGDLLTLIDEGDVCLVINTPTHGRNEHSDGFRIRRAAVEHGIPCLTSIDTAKALLKGMKEEK